MTNWEGKSRGAVAGYKFFIFLLKYPGLKFSYFFLHFVVIYYVLFAHKARKPIYSYFRKILGFGKWKSTTYLFKNFYKLGQVLLDKVAFLAGFSDKFTFNQDGEQYLKQMAAGEGGFLIGAHIGNWEVAGQLLDNYDTRVHILMLEAERQQIKALLDQVMTKKSISIIAINDDLSHLFRIKEALDKNEIIAMHGDRFIEGSPTIEGTLLGYPALFPLGPFLLPLKFNKPVSFVSAVKETDTHYHLYATKPKNYADGRVLPDKKEKPGQILYDYTMEMERILKMHPEQWFNYFYFWAAQKE